MGVDTSARGPSNHWRPVVFLVLFCLAFSVTFTRAQDVAEAARQERARKDADRKATHHVYTEEDLKRDRILNLEDQAKALAREKHQQGASGEQDAKAMPPEQTQQPESLGDVARRYREQKAARDAEQAQHKKFTPFPYKVPEQTLTAPKPEIVPLKRPALGSDVREESHTVAAPVPPSVPRGAGLPPRISPFQPRPLLAPPPAVSVAPVGPPVRNRVESPIASLTIPYRSFAGLRPLKVQRGDSWWRLAERYLGSGARWPELRSLNTAATDPPDTLRQGSLVLVPETPVVRADHSESRIIVKRGDTLWALARLHLGRGSAWKCLARANPRVSDSTRLTIGASLRLPAGDTPESCQSNEKLRR
jgi:nucleoid-associated protein YgaU